jgi:hypothetical protein
MPTRAGQRSGLTDTRSAIPGQLDLPSPPKKETSSYERTAPTGVDAAKIATCFLHAERGREVDKRDVVRASAVGPLASLSVHIHKMGNGGKATFMNEKR